MSLWRWFDLVARAKSISGFGAFFFHFNPSLLLLPFFWSFCVSTPITLETKTTWFMSFWIGIYKIYSSNNKWWLLVENQRNKQKLRPQSSQWLWVPTRRRWLRPGERFYPERTHLMIILQSFQSDNHNLCLNGWLWRECSTDWWPHVRKKSPQHPVLLVNSVTYSSLRCLTFPSSSFHSLYTRGQLNSSYWCYATVCRSSASIPHFLSILCH